MKRLISAFLSMTMLVNINVALASSLTSVYDALGGESKPVEEKPALGKAEIKLKSKDWRTYTYKIYEGDLNYKRTSSTYMEVVKKFNNEDYKVVMKDAQRYFGKSSEHTPWGRILSGASLGGLVSYGLLQNSVATGVAVLGSAALGTFLTTFFPGAFIVGILILGLFKDKHYNVVYTNEIDVNKDKTTAMIVNANRVEGRDTLSTVIVPEKNLVGSVEQKEGAPLVRGTYTKSKCIWRICVWVPFHTKCWCLKKEYHHITYMFLVNNN